MSTATIPVFLLFAGSMKSPSSTKLLTADTAPPPPASLVGRIMDTGPNFEFRKIVGSGMIRLVWNRSAAGTPSTVVLPVLGSIPLLRSGNDRFSLVSLQCGAFHALSYQNWECIG